MEELTADVILLQNISQKMAAGESEVKEQNDDDFKRLD